MTTDRASAASRPSALAERPSPGSRKPAAADAFSALLSAQAPGPDAKPAARPDAPPLDNSPGKGAEPPGAADPAPAADQPQPQAPAPPLPVTFEQLAAQLTSPLPATPQQPVAAPPAGEAPPQPAPVLATVVAPAPPAQIPAPQQPLAAPPAGEAPPPPPLAEPAVPAAEPPQLPTLPSAPKGEDAKPAAAQAPQAPAAANAAHVQPDTGNPEPQSQPQGRQAPTPAPAPSTAPPADAPRPAEAAKPADAAPAQPLQAPAPAQPAAATERAVPLYRAPQVAAAVIQLAQERGVTHARINLKPAELGGIEVRLQTTPQGVTAHLVADSPEAAKALQQAGDDLRRQLEARDVNLLSLDVSTSGDGRHAGFGRDAAGDGSRNGAHGSSYGFGDDDEDTPAPPETTLVLPDGVLVDVLA